jgi:C_GCAxxG_C_C family probable redox protein
MWETSELGSEDLLWATTALHGGIAGQREATCGAVSGGVVYLGLRHRVPMANKEQAEQARLLIREHARQVVRSFTKEYGSIICCDVLGIDFSDPEAVQQFRESGRQREKCDSYVKFVIEKLYELESS